MADSEQRRGESKNLPFTQVEGKTLRKRLDLPV